MIVSLLTDEFVLSKNKEKEVALKYRVWLVKLFVWVTPSVLILEVKNLNMFTINGLTTIFLYLQLIFIYSKSK